jgi:hypothetical protein
MAETPRDLEAIKSELLRLADNPSKEGLQTLAGDIDRILHPPVEAPVLRNPVPPPPTVPRGVRDQKD